jgi:hypothetical protein
MVEFWLIALMVACCLLCGWIAERRERPPKLWVWLGAIFGPIALIFLIVLPSHRSKASV